MLTIALAAAAATAQPQPLRSFADWIIGCDNGGRCTAEALQPVDWDGDPDTRFNLTLIRDAGASAPVRIDWDNDIANSITLLVDGRVVAANVTRNMALPAAAVQALRQGRQATLRTVNGARLSASLAGLSATLLAMDDAQGRVGTSSALVRPGTRAMTAAVPVLPLIVRPAASSAAPRTLTAERAAAFIADDLANCGDERPPVDVLAHRLDAGHSLVMIPQMCSNGAYNYFTTIMIVDEQGRVSPARFEMDPGMGGEIGDPPGNVAVNVTYDEATRVLTTYAKGRGIGDCGTISDFVWDGSRFAVSQRFEMSECRGRINYIPVWRATVR